MIHSHISCGLTSTDLLSLVIKKESTVSDIIFTSKNQYRQFIVAVIK